MSRKNMKLRNCHPLVRNRFIILSVIWGFLWVLSALAFPRAASAQEAQSVIRDLQSKFSKIQSLEASLDISGALTKPSNKTESFKASGKVYAQKPDYFRVDLSGNVVDPDRDSPVKFNSQLLLDGKTLWITINNSEGKASFLSSVDFLKLKEDFPKIFSHESGQGYYNPFDQLKELNLKQAKVMGKSVVEGKEIVILESTLRRNPPISLPNLGAVPSSFPLKVRLWIGRSDGVTYQAEVFNHAGKKGSTLHLTHVRKNKNLDPALFHFTVPEGATPIDMTDVIEETLRHPAKTPVTIPEP